MFEERSGKLKETNQWEPLEYIKALRLPMVCKIPMVNSFYLITGIDAYINCSINFF